MRVGLYPGLVGLFIGLAVSCQAGEAFKALLDPARFPQSVETMPDGITPWRGEPARVRAVQWVGGTYDGMRVDQQVHAEYSAISSSGSSKSGAISTRPLALPKTGRASGASVGPNWATGLPRRVTMITVPWCAFSMRLEKCVLASNAPIVSVLMQLVYQTGWWCQPRKRRTLMNKREPRYDPLCLLGS